jgi:DnaJ-domain-containing protein 1
MPSDRADATSSLPSPSPSHYQLLGVDPQVSAADLRQAFRSLSKRYHPDTTTLPAAEAQEAFARLQQAYAVLADPDRRRVYDAQLKLQQERSQALRQALITPPPLNELQRPLSRPIGVRRSLSGGEWFALVLLALALALSLVLGFGVAWARGAALITPPSWLVEASASAALEAPQQGLADGDQSLSSAL